MRVKKLASATLSSTDAGTLQQNKSFVEDAEIKPLLGGEAPKPLYCNMLQYRGLQHWMSTFAREKFFIAINRVSATRSQKDRDTILGEIHRLTDSSNKNFFTNITVA